MRIFNVVFIVLFMLMLMLPLAFADLSGGKVFDNENRRLAKRPSFADMKKSPENFTGKFNDWFKDHTGFREQMLAMHRLLEIRTGTWYKGGRYIYLAGEQGHHFSANENAFLISKFQGKKFISDSLLQNMAAKLEEVKTYLDNKGIPLTVMFCTDKESVYPEFYPKSIKRGPEPIQLEVITEYLREHTSADVFNIRQALLAEKDKYPMYFLVDTKNFSREFSHYNEIGAFFAYRDLMKHINIHLPEIIPYGLDDIKIDYDKKGIPKTSLKTKPTYKKQDSDFFDNVKLNRPFTWENAAYKNANPNLPTILFLQDSYSGYQYIGKYFAQQFGEAIFIHYNNVANIKEYIEKYKPDIVVFESAERELIRFAKRIEGIPKLQ